MVEILERKYFIPEKAIFYLSKFCCQKCFRTTDDLDKTMSQMKKKNSFLSLFKKLKP
jgi:hypothetical protein